MTGFLSGIDSIVVFRNCHGRVGRGTLIHVSRTTLIFEIYNPFAIIQLSEVLNQVQIVRGDRVVYRGRAVVSHIEMAGLMLIVSATLIDAWSDTRDMDSSNDLSIEAARFVDDWISSHELVSDYQLTVGALGSYLADLNHWLEEAESGLREASFPGLGHTESKLEETYREIRFPLWLKIADLYEDFERVVLKVPAEKLNAHKSYARRVLHPLILCAPLVSRAYGKPSGYAGDAQLLGMLLGEASVEPPTLYARMVNDFHVNAAIAQAYRNRMDAVVERLTTESSKAIRRRETFRVLGLGSGTGLEIVRFLEAGKLIGAIHVDWVDGDLDAMEASVRRIEAAARASGNEVHCRIHNKTVDDLLREGLPGWDLVSAPYDMVYSFCLFDYLPDRIGEKVLRQVGEWVESGGRITVGCVDRSNPNRAQMEHLMEWYMVYRDERCLSAIVPNGLKREVSRDGTGVNLMLDIMV